MELISNEECFKIVQKSFSRNFEILNYLTESASENSVGYLGEYYRLIVDIKEENGNTAKLSYFIKSLPIKNQIERNRFVELGIFRKEIAIYENLLAKFQIITNPNEMKWHPLCYHTRSDIIVLEDLPNLGYYQLSDDKPLTINHIKAVLTSLAQLHAHSIAFEVNNSISIDNEFKAILFETTVEENNDWFHAGLQAVKTIALLHPKYQTKEHQSFILNEFMIKIRPIYEMVNRSNKFRNVLCHRDAWGKNIFFKCENSNVNCNTLSSALVDFQLCRYCPPAIDILFFIYFNTNRSLRAHIFDECIRWYHEQLENYLTDLQIQLEYHISFEEIELSCKELKLFGILCNCAACTFLKIPNDFLTNLKENSPELYYQFACVNRNDEVSRFVKSDRKFKEFMFEIIEELMELIYY